MSSQKESASTPSVASTVLPSATIIEFRKTRQAKRQPVGFTKAGISKMQCRPGRAETLYWDAACRGFGLRTLESGRRTWIFQYRDEHKRTRRIALGDATAVTLDAARQAARQLAASVTQGANPSADRKAKKGASTVLSVIEAYLSRAKTKLRPRSYEETERHLLKHAASLHFDKAEAVQRADIARLLDKVSIASGPFAANRLRAALSALWSWGMRAGLISSDVNPVTFTLRHPERARERILSDEELRVLWSATEDEGDYSRIVRLCLLTGCRRDEIGGLRWDEIFPDRLVVGAARMKAGTAHEVPMLPAIAAALPIRSKESRDCVFGRRGTGFSGWSRSKAGLDARLTKMGSTIQHWTLHDLRRTLSTRLHDAGIEPLVVEALLAHKQQGVAAVYNRASFRQAKHDALERWHKIIFEMVRSIQPGSKTNEADRNS